MGRWEELHEHVCVDLVSARARVFEPLIVLLLIYVFGPLAVGTRRELPSSFGHFELGAPPEMLCASEGGGETPVARYFGCLLWLHRL